MRVTASCFKWFKSLSIIFIVLLLSSCFKLKHKVAGTNSNQIRPPETQSTGQTQVPAGETLLSSESLKLSVTGQSPDINLVESNSAVASAAVTKNFLFHSTQNLRVKLDREAVQSSLCGGVPLSSYEVKIASSEGVSDLRQTENVALHANVDYAFRVRLANSGRCQNVSYRFAVIALPGTTATPAPVPVSRLTAPVNCDWVDNLGYSGKLQFDPAFNSISTQSGMNAPFLILYGEKIACGVQPNNNPLKCDPTSQFNGDAFSRSLACSSVNFFGVGETPVSAGTLSFSLRSGQGSLICSAYGTTRASLTLKACKPATDIEDGE